MNTILKAHLKFRKDVTEYGKVAFEYEQTFNMLEIERNEGKLYLQENWKDAELKNGQKSILNQFSSQLSRDDFNNDANFYYVCNNKDETDKKIIARVNGNYYEIKPGTPKNCNCNIEIF